MTNVLLVKDKNIKEKYIYLIKQQKFITKKKLVDINGNQKCIKCTKLLDSMGHESREH